MKSLRGRKRDAKFGIFGERQAAPVLVGFVV